MYFDRANNYWVAAVSLGSKAGKRVRRKVTGRTKTEVKAKWFPQSQRHRAERVALPSEVYMGTSRMTVRRPNLSPARTTCLTLARPRCADFSRDRQPHEPVMPRLRSLTWTVVIVPQSQRHSAAWTVPSGIAFRVSARTVSLP